MTIAPFYPAQDNQELYRHCALNILTYETEPYSDEMRKQSILKIFYASEDCRNIFEHFNFKAEIELLKDRQYYETAAAVENYMSIREERLQQKISEAIMAPIPEIKLPEGIRIISKPNKIKL